MTSFATVAKQQIAADATATLDASLDTTTWNGAVSHSTSGAARVDFFYGAMRGVDKARFVELMDKSFAEDALHTLKLIAYVRDCRGGKGERQLGRFALEHLAAKYPRELLHNLKFFVGDFGRYDDVMALMNSPVEKSALDLLAKQLEADLAALKQSEETATEQATEDGEAAEKKASRSPSISLCAKWVPSEKKALDKKLQMNKKLSRHMGLKPAQLRKLYLSPLREKLRILERYMCAKDWESINFNAVPSVAMHIHGKPKHAFERHLGDKFSEWKGKLAKGETKVNAKALFPHQVVAEYLGHRRSEVDELLEAQWKVLVEEASQTGDLQKTLVLSDVSGSMNGRPMEVSIALGLMISSLAQDEYKDLVLTFESNPKFHHVEGGSLFERVRNLERAPWGGSTDFAAAFRAVLSVATRAKLTKDQMPERLIVVSDMQFNSADSNFETNYQVLKREFEAAGYDVPHLVFWNVNGATRDVPTYSGQAKVSLVSGFSTAILKSVLTGTEITPLQTVLNVVTDERYDSITLPPTEGGEAGEEDDGVLL